MATTVFLGVLFVTYFALSHCDNESDKELTDSANCFTLNLYKKMAEGKTNVVASPFSVDVLLSMLYVGSDGDTALELSNALGYDNFAIKELEEAFRSQLSKMTSSNGNTLDLDNSIWIQKGFDVEQSFKDSVKNYFNSQVYDADFRDDPHEATNDINNWANKSTRGVIPKIFDEDLDPSTVLLLASAIYFNGTWQHQFETRATENGVFLNNDNQKSSNTVQFMHQRARFNYKMDTVLNAQVLEMQYVGGDVSMMVVLPGSNSNIQELEDSLTCDTFKNGIQFLESRFVEVTLPKYEITSDFNLEDSIKALGIEDIFSDNADLSGISDNIKVSKAVQKSTVKVNEAGSEAAVVTAVGLTPLSLPSDVVSFVADHPFMFLIVDKRTGIVLFMGSVKQYPTS